MDWTPIAEALQQLTPMDYLYLGLSVLGLAVLLVFLVRRQPRKIKAYSTDNGQVMVSRSAIVELVQTSCEQIKEVSKPRVRMRIKGPQTHFEVRLKLASGGQLRTIEETLQTHLRRALTENLGIENLGRINILATGFKSGRLETNLTQAKSHPSSHEASTGSSPSVVEDASDLEIDTEQR